MSYYHVPCPNCYRSLYFPEKEQIQIMCPQCRCLYLVENFSLTDLSKNILHKKNSSLTQEGNFVIKGRNNTKKIERVFSLFLHPKYIQFEIGDSIAILTLISKTVNNVNKKVSIVNLTRENNYRLFKPDHLSLFKGLKVFVFLFLSTWILTTLLSRFYPRLQLAQIGIIPVAIAIGIKVQKRDLNSHTNLDLTNARLMSFSQTIYQQIHELTTKRDTLLSELISEQTTIDRLTNLQQRMRDLDEQQYLHRIETIRRARELMQSRQAVGNNLLNDYNKTIEMLSIELETAQITEELPEGAQFKIYQRLEQLEQLEAQKEELKLTIDPLLFFSW